MPSALKLIIGADSDPFAAKMRLLEKTSAASANGIGRTFSGVTGRLVASFGSLLGLGALTRYAKATSDWAGKLRASADALGVNVEWLQRMDHGAKMAGANIEHLAQVLGEMNKSRQEALANPKGKNAAAFERLGVSRPDLSQLNTQSFFEKIVKAFSHGATVQATNDVQVVGGKAARNLVAAFAGQFASDAPILSEQLIDELDRAGDSITDLSQTLRVFLAPAVVFAADSIRAAFNNLNAVSAGIEDFAANLWTPDVTPEMEQHKSRYRQKLDTAVASGKMTPEQAEKKYSEFSAIATPAAGGTTMTLREAFASAGRAVSVESRKQEAAAAAAAKARSAERTARRARENAPPDFAEIVEIKPEGKKSGGGYSPELTANQRIGAFAAGPQLAMIDVNKQQLTELRGLRQDIKQMNSPGGRVPTRIGGMRTT